MSLDIISLRAGVDWLSQTIQHEEGKYASWRNIGNACLEQLGREGHVLRGAGFNGYQGVRAGGSFVGVREDGTLLQFSGPQAERFYDYIYSAEANTPRIDLQVTIKFAEMPLHLAKEMYQHLRSANGKDVGGPKQKLTYIEGSDGGATLYVGAPSSRQRGRIYNKEVQSEEPEYAKCWRFEVTFKDDLARSIAAKVARRQDERPRLCNLLVHEWFSRRGIDCPWYARRDEDILPIVRSLPTDIEKRLKWLERQVKPALKEMRILGYGADALAALGLSFTGECTMDGISWSVQEGG